MKVLLAAILTTLAVVVVRAQLYGPYYADFTVAGSGYFCWTQWLDRDNPSGTGDHETLVDMPQDKVCEKPVGIQCQTVGKVRSDLTGEVFITPCEPRVGLQCLNVNQVDDGKCLDYRVRFLCPAGTIKDQTSISYCKAFCWSDWLDRDEPSGSGDWETISDYASSRTCSDPVGVQCREKDTKVDWKDVGQVYRCNSYAGGICINTYQDSGVMCVDYEARFLCNCGICI